MSAPALPPAELFQHAEFLKRLARGLLRDEHLAEDAVQDAFVAALERPPRAEGALAGWLARVARHLALNRRTSEDRRARRERTVARAEAVDGVVAQRLELQRFVSDLVLRLDEAKRMAIYLRYYEGLEPQAIAERLGVPVKTVKTRLARGLAELRERLDARAQGDRSAWVSAFLPLATASRSALPAASAGIVGGLLMKKTIVAAGLVLAAWWLWRTVSSERVEGVASAEQAESVAALEPAASAPPPAPPPLASQPAGRVAPAGAAAAAGDATTLSVQVVAAETGAPLAGIGLALHEPTGAWSTEPGTASSGGLGSLRSDAEGRAAFTVPAGTELWLEVNSLNFAPADSARESIPALASGEQRALVVRLATALELVWCGQIVDGTSEVPLAGARVERVLMDPFEGPAGEVIARSSADGRVQLAYASWSTSYARFALDGYATGFVHLDAGHERPATALPVRLLRAAELEMLVTDPSGAPREGVQVRVSCDAYERMQGSHSYAYVLDAPPFVGRTDARGRCVLADLPPELQLDLELRDGKRLLRHEERALRLEPGERRALTWTVGGLCRLTGRTLEVDGRPAAGVAVWLLPDDGERLLREYRDDEVTAKVRSDADGRFTLEVPAGAWLVGPSPTALSDIAPAAERLVVAPEDTHAELTLTCQRGLFLRGLVRGPDGESATSCFVSAQSEDAYADDSVHTGEFSLGPLPAGTYTVRANGYLADGLAPSEPLTVAAGTEGIDLILRRGAELEVRVLDSSGNPASDAMLWVLAEPGSEGGLGTTPTDGVATFRNLVPGTFSVSAASPSGEFALARGVTLTSGNPRELELRLQPAPRLRITLQPPPEGRTNVEVRQDGRPLALVFPDQNPLTALAPGEYELVLQRIGGGRTVELSRLRVTVAAEGETSAVFDLAEAR